MHFDEAFFAGEEKLGFYIRPIMKRMWAVEMEVLSVIAEICDKYGIRWFIDSGSLLGTIRHQGFIPWDDDVDISMMRSDFNRFLQVAPAELPDGWRLFNGSQDQSPTGIITRVINTETVRIDPEFLSRNHGCPYIMGVDIFVLDAVPDDPEEDEIFRALLTMAYDVFGKTDNSMMLRDCAPDVKEEVDQLRVALDVDIDSSLPIKRQILVLADQIVAIYNDTGAENVTIEPFYVNRPEVRIPASCYDETVEMSFESMRVPVPTGYDTILRTWYGENYMTPVQSNPHPALDESERRLREYYEMKGMEFPKEFE